MAELGAAYFNKAAISVKENWYTIDKGAHIITYIKSLSGNGAWLSVHDVSDISQLARGVDGGSEDSFKT